MDEASATAYGLFGREDAVRVVNDLLDLGGSVVTIGEPGAGKSSLLKVADQLAQRRGHRVLSVSPTQFDRGLPFAGLAELVNQCPDGAVDRLPGPQRRALAVALQRAESDGQEIDPLAVPLAVRTLLTQLCDDEPVALIVDDLQWLDRASVGSLGFAVRNLDPRRLSVLIGSRPDPDAGADLLRSLPAPRREVVLGPLAESAIGQLLRKRLGPRWIPPMAAGVARASGGNPFLALMIAQAMQSDVSKWRWSSQQGHEPIFPVPPSLAGLLGEKVGLLLSQDAREVLLLVSTAGRLTVAQLQGMVEETRLRAALEAAGDADVAKVGAGAVVAFTHPMLASALYDVAAPDERRRAHRMLADKLDDPVERARHRARSTTTPDEAVAGELERAADISRGRGAQQLAGELLEGAALATPSDTSESLRRWLRAVDTYIGAGDILSAESALDKGATLAVVPEQHAQVLARRARLTNDLRGSRSLAEEAFRMAPPGEVRAAILQTLSEQHRMEGNGKLALRLARIAIAEAGAAGRPDIQLVALYQRRSVECIWALDDPQQTLRDMEHLVETSSIELTPAEWAGARAFYAAWNDEAAETIVRDAIARALDAGRYGDLSSLYIWLVLVLIRASKIPAAEAALDEADRSGAWTTLGLQENMARVLIKEYAGDLDAAREVAESAAARARAGGLRYWLGGFLAQLGFIEISAGNWQAALEPLRELAGIFASTSMVDLEQLLWPVDLADAALQVGALQDVETAIALLRRQGAAGRSEATIAADRCQALLTAARGDAAGAVTALRQLVDRTGSECPFEATRTLLALGQVYRRAGFRSLAGQTLTEAATTFDELGIPRWAARAREEAGRVGLHPSESMLTATERRVAELVAAGRSNQEAAAELFLSVKTVEANLTRVYRKLTVRSRTELANRLNADGVSSGRREGMKRPGP
jgi:DNA-binding NarL/FixJ family response regulator/energy-coupling factor transporter ATP-binding protein EcfA2